MHLQSEIVVRRPAPQVSAFLGDISNVAKWDRGVSSARQTSAASSTNGVGLEFDTLAYGDNADDRARGQMSYRVTEIGPDYSVLELTSTEGNARFFKNARWTFRLHPHPQGTLIVCAADFQLRSWYVLLAPVFFSMKSAIRRDLESLKKVLEKADLPGSR